MSAKDYFQDITPPSSDQPRPLKVNAAPAAASASEPDPPQVAVESSERSIRNIQVPQRARRSGTEVRSVGTPPSSRGLGRMWLWGGTGLAILVLAALGLVALRPTTVTVVPRSHIVLFDETANFTAYPAESAAAGTLSFTTETSTYEDSQTVQANGVERAEEKASGNITIYNEYSTSPQRLLKNTRFETPDGLIFRAPAEIIVPGRKGATPGEITVMVIADQAGEKYNVGPVSRFTLPGLKSSSDMYKKIYARSSAAMSGGFSGDRPATAPAELERAMAEIRGRLEEKARMAIGAREDGAFAFYELARATFESLPPVSEGEKNVRITERLTMELPIFPADLFAQTVAESVSAGVGENGVVLKPLEDFAAQTAATSSFSATTPLSFGLVGQAQLVWKVDTAELAAALAGRDESAFQTIVEGFAGIAEAKARIEPFWKRTFPEDALDIKVKVKEPELPRSN
ncbi:hypothetical protein HY414_01985 [Candidatus Kaiserbacteria bacterium]|nr:hypothetical protein [Candidatus Kaiserbacteria bacterium]